MPSYSRSRSRSRGRYRSYSRSRSRSRSPEDDGCRVHVGDLGIDCSKTEITHAFSRFGKLEEVWLARNPPCFAFVVYKRREDAELAIREMDGGVLCNGRVRVSHARPRTRGQRRSRGFDPNLRCYQCGEKGHFSRDCDEVWKYRQRGFKDKSRSRSRSRDKRSRSRSRSPKRSDSRSTKKSGGETSRKQSGSGSPKRSTSTKDPEANGDGKSRRSSRRESEGESKSKRSSKSPRKRSDSGSQSHEQKVDAGGDYRGRSATPDRHSKS